MVRSARRGLWSTAGEGMIADELGSVWLVFVCKC